MSVAHVQAKHMAKLSILVLYAALEAILHACLDRNCMSVEKFSRWLRAICTILLARNTPTDRAKAVGYVEQGVSVIESNSHTESEKVGHNAPGCQLY